VGDSLLGRRTISHIGFGLSAFYVSINFPFSAYPARFFIGILPVVHSMESYLYQDLYALEDTHWWHRNKRRLVIALFNHYRLNKKIRIIDVGCGTGKNVETFASLGESWGLDVSQRAIAYCRKRGLTRIKRGTAQKTELPSSFFDGITLLDVLEHTDDRKTMAEMQRILKPGGIIVITVPAYKWMWSRWDEVLHHKRRYEKADLENVLMNNGFRMLKLSFVYSFLLVPALIIRFIKSRFIGSSYGSDFQLSNSFLNEVLLAVCQMESRVIVSGSVPFGTSLVAVAQKTK
jgi:SAM-dependent methyltransferase